MSEVHKPRDIGVKCSSALGNESTHYQRAHKNAVRRLFSRKVGDERKYCFARSIDDKAYVRPGTTEGFGKTRNKRILTPSANERSRQLPKYDWPEKKVYVTPSTHRILSKTSVDVDGEECFVNSEDTHVVFTRPKSYVESIGTTWANETERLRCMMPDKFEVPSDNNQPVYTKNFRETCARMNDDVKLFTMMTMNEDLERATLQSNTENKHRLYETERLKHLKKRLSSVSNSENLQLLSEGEKKLYVSNILPCIQDILARTEQVLSMFGENANQDILPSYTDLLNKCNKVLKTLNDLRLPLVKPRWFENSDAGPGVGVSNFEVRFMRC